MISETSSCLTFNYQEPAVDYSLWEKPDPSVDYSLWHGRPTDSDWRIPTLWSSEKVEVKYALWNKTWNQTTQLTISPTLLAQLNEFNCISFTMTGVPMGSLNYNVQSVTDDFNKGPYMDILSYSLRPITNPGSCICLFDSAGGTPVEKTLQITQKTESLGVNVSAAAAYQGPVSQMTIGPGLNGSFSRGTSFHTEETTFKQMEYVDGQKRVLIFSLNKCKSGNTLVPYDVEQVSMLKKAFSIQDLFSYNAWCYAWTPLHTPPATAISAFNADWTVKYFLSDQDQAQFEWTTEVRTVVASSNRICRSTDITEKLSWIKTVHRITQLFEININKEKKTLSMKAISKKVEKICSHGFDDYVAGKVLIDQSST